LNSVEIDEAVSELVEQPFNAEEFPFAFLEAFGNPGTTIKRLRKGDSNRTDVPGAVLQRSNIHILVTEPGGVEEGLSALRASPKTAQQKAKFVLATDGEELQAEDLRTGELVACQLVDLPKHFGFLLPLAGISAVAEIKNNPIDIKATGRLDKLYVALLEENPEWAKQENREDFNHFMAQLIFCFFAEDTGIFNGDSLFTQTVRQMSESDGSNTNEVIAQVFGAMNLDPRKGERTGVRPYADVFPYVNGGLFGGEVKVPRFSRIARTYLLRAGDLDWTAINPDIFGSMIQAVADDDERGELGMHYTSVPNILKVLNPLFLDSLRADLERAGNNRQQLGKLKKRLAGIRVFDPACGSGNFLVIAYKQMREIEHRANIAAGWAEKTEQIGDDGTPIYRGVETVIPLTNFRGIEIKSFAAEIARLALIIAEFQCDELYMGQREALALFLPLEKQNWVACGNALHLDWLSVCPPPGVTAVKLHSDDLFESPLDQSEIDFENEGGEVFVCGNPPYLGSKRQSAEQKADLKAVFDGLVKNWKSLDYVSAWFYLSAKYLSHTNGVAAFVATNSICQGQHVPILWPLLFEKRTVISFAYTSFKWANLAAHNAGVTVVVVGITSLVPKQRLLYTTNKDGEVLAKSVRNINAYLVNGPDVVVRAAANPLSSQQPMQFGNHPYYATALVFKYPDARAYLKADPSLERFIRPFYGSTEFISNSPRYCFWIEEDDVALAEQSSIIKSKMREVREARLAAKKDKTAQKLASTPYRFRDQYDSNSHTIIVPRVSSENRDYLPVGLLSASCIVQEKAFAMYDGPLWSIAIVASRLHWVWIGTVCVRMRTDFSYSNTLGWNTFPIPQLTSRQKEQLNVTAQNILLARESHYPATIADLYKLGAMPENLIAAHEANDQAVEEIYVGRRFKNDSERLECLFDMYLQMTKESEAA